MDMEQIKCVVSAAKCKNFTEASYEVSLSQSSLSKKIARLEDELGVRLFDRTTREVTLTSAGSKFVLYAERMISLYDQICTEVSAANVKDSHLNIGTVHFSQGQSWIPYIADFSKVHPHIKITLTEDTTEPLVEKVLSGALDIAFVVSIYPSIAIEPVPSFAIDRRFKSYSVSKDPYYLVASYNHPLARKKITDFSDLQDYKIITIDKKTGVYHSAFSKLYKSEGLEKNIAYTCNSVRDALMLISANAGVGLFSSMVASDGKDVVLIPMKRPMIRDTQMIMLNQPSVPQSAQIFFSYFKKLNLASQ